MSAKQNWRIASDNFQLHPRLPLAAANKEMRLSSQMDNERRVLSETAVLLLIGGAVMGLAGLVHTLGLRLWCSDLCSNVPNVFFRHRFKAADTCPENSQAEDIEHIAAVVSKEDLSPAEAKISQGKQGCSGA